MANSDIHLALNRCTANRKTCKKCKYRFLKTDDKSPGAKCPECGYERRCESRATTGYTVCHMHGSGTPARGTAGGRPAVTYEYSRFLPEKLGERAVAATKDPDLLSLRQDIAAIHARITEVMEELEETVSETGIKYLQSVLNNFDANRIDESKVIEHFRNAVDITKNKQYAWGSLLEYMEQKRKLTDSEIKRLVEMNQVITVEELAATIARLRVIIAKYLKPGMVIDESVLFYIQQDLHGLMNNSNNSRAPIVAR